LLIQTQANFYAGGAQISVDGNLDLMCVESATLEPNYRTLILRDIKAAGAAQAQVDAPARAGVAQVASAAAGKPASQKDQKGPGK
jgi:hypothetical protein